MSRTVCLRYRKAITEGSMLVLDPSSGGTSNKGVESNAGWAVFKEGKLAESGILELDHGEKKEVRLRRLGAFMLSDFGHHDLFVIEDITGYKAPKTLIQACGGLITNTKSDGLIEMNVRTWQAIALRLGGWEKSDEADAIYMGWACVAFALGYNQKDTEDRRECVLKEVRELMLAS